MSRRYPFLLLCLIFINCYSSDRDNPLDPIRTEAVELKSIEFDDVTQTATLVWTPYHGIEPFQQYQIQRDEPGEEPSIVGTVGTVADTSYVDDTILPGITYTYWVLVRNTADLTVLSVPKEGLSGNVVAPIQILPPVLDHLTATAHIRWTRFPGTTFSSYELIRRTPQDAQTLAILQGSADTTFTDINLLGNVAYTYEVALNTTDGRRFSLSAEPDGIYLRQASFGNLSDPQGIDVDASGQHIYVADTGNGRIKKYSRDGSLLLSWGEPGEEDHQFFRPPSDVAVDQAGNVWVAVPAYDPKPPPTTYVKKFDASGLFLLKVDLGNSVFTQSLSLDANGDMFGVLPKADGERLLRLDLQGNVLFQEFISSFTPVGFTPNDFRAINSFSNTTAITNGQQGVFLFNIDNLNLAPSFIGRFGSQGSGPGEFNDPQGLDFGTTGFLFVVDAGNNRMQVFDDVVNNPNNPTFITQWGLPSPAQDVAVDSQGSIYVIAGGQVHKYVP